MRFLTKKEIAAFLVAPLVASLFLFPWFVIPQSPFFLGSLAPEENIGVGLSALAVMINGSILGYLTVGVFSIPTYLAIRSMTGMTLWRLYLLAGVSGVLASLLVRFVQNFKQPLLRSFAESMISPIFGLFCGLTAAAIFSFIAGGSIAKMNSKRGAESQRQA